MPLKSHGLSKPLYLSIEIGLYVFLISNLRSTLGYKCRCNIFMKV